MGRLLTLLGLGFGAWGLYRLGTAVMSPANPSVALQAGYYLVEQPSRVLAVGAHPGDVEFFAGGTLMQMARAGSEVTILTLTRGERAAGRRNLAEIRSREAEKAAALLRAHRLILHDFPDGGLDAAPEMAGAIESAWREVRPEVVMTFDPSARWPAGRNPDHVALGVATLETARGRLREGVKLLLYAPRLSNLIVDTTEVFQEKLQVLRAHQSVMPRPAPVVPLGVALHDVLGRGTAPTRYVERFHRLA